jgi:hypothetical protein
VPAGAKPGPDAGGASGYEAGGRHAKEAAAKRRMRFAAALSGYGIKPLPGRSGRPLHMGKEDLLSSFYTFRQKNALNI